ncbi:MAG: hypothetical protein IPM29_30145 [Planctomycetes bacterium]|nr:hypothetical protein [Planctomycetota bacterium]
MTHLRSTLLVLGLAAAVSAQAPTVQISIGVRETGASGGVFTNIGDNGGATGGIEFINRDGQTLVLDGTWQQFTFNLATDPITSFAGSTANGILDGGFGTLEHIRILNSQGILDPISIWVDDVADTITPAGGSPTTTTFGTFQGYADGAEVMFQEPSFSGSTAGFLQTGSTSEIDNYTASRTASYAFNFQFINLQPTNWVRLTTFNTINQGNPMVRFDQNSVVTFWLRGGVGQENLGSQGPGNAIAEMCGTGLGVGNSSTYYLAGAQPGAPGAMAVSFAGLPDVPILGGNLVSFVGFIGTLPVAADANGRFSTPSPGSSILLDLVFQTVLFDPNTTSNLAFTNALLVRYGR